MNNDKLKLNVSKSFTLVKENEVVVDLNLATPTINSLGSVSGTVYDTTLLTGEVVEGATVKVFLSDGTPYAHTVTGKDGSYLSVAVPLTISSTLPVSINLVLVNNTEGTKNIIYGIVDDSLNALPIDNVNVSLYKVVDGEKILAATTTTIADGEYTLDKIEEGTYTIMFDKSGYQTAEITNIVLTKATKFNANMTLTSIVGNINSTVLGIIKTESGVIVPNAYVGLYKITEKGEELVAVTYTNKEGKYMFGNVLEGEYVVKAKLAEAV